MQLCIITAFRRVFKIAYAHHRRFSCIINHPRSTRFFLNRGCAKNTHLMRSCATWVSRSSSYFLTAFKSDCWHKSSFPKYFRMVFHYIKNGLRWRKIYQKLSCCIFDQLSFTTSLNPKLYNIPLQYTWKKKKRTKMIMLGLLNKWNISLTKNAMTLRWAGKPDDQLDHRRSVTRARRSFRTQIMRTSLNLQTRQSHHIMRWRRIQPHTRHFSLQMRLGCPPMRILANEYLSMVWDHPMKSGSETISHT